MKGNLIIYSINRLQEGICNKTRKRHVKKLDALVINKRIIDGIKPNPNNLVTNLTSFELTEDEVEVLRLGLKHGLLVRPKESEMIVVIEDVYDQILRNHVLNDNQIAKHRVEVALKSFTYNYLDLDFKYFGLDQKRIKLLRNLRERCMILKPDKGQGIVLINKSDYLSSLERLFNDTTKFRICSDDPTLRNLSTLRRYLNTLADRGEITDEEKKLMNRNQHT